MDDACVYIVRTRTEIESRARVDQDFKLGAFAAPPDAPGRYGPFSNPEARRAFVKLQDLGVIATESFNPESTTLTYRWTELGDEVRTLL